MNALDVILIVAGVGFILVRRMLGQLVQLKKLVILPLVLTVVGAGELGHPSAAAVAFVALSALLSVALGTARGATIHLGERDGHLWMRYRAITVALWAANLVGKAVLVGVAHVVAPHASAGGEGLMFALGLGVLAETLVVGARALRSDAAVVWSQGRNGGAPTHSPAFEQLRAWARSTR